MRAAVLLGSAGPGRVLIRWAPSRYSNGGPTLGFHTVGPGRVFIQRAYVRFLCGGARPGFHIASSDRAFSRRTPTGRALSRWAPVDVLYSPAGPSVGV